METYPLRDQEGQVYAFEIPISYFPTAGSIGRFLSKCPGVQVTKQRKLFEFGNEVHVEFLFDETPFHAWEPYGDNSRLWIGPSIDHPIRVAAIDKLIGFVSNNWPGPVSRARGKVLSWFR